MCKVEKCILTYDFDILFETYDKEEAQDMQKSFNEKLKGEKVVLEIYEVDANQAVKELLSVVKEKKNLIEMQSQNFKKLKALQVEDTEKFIKTIDKKDEMLKAQGQIIVELQKKCEEMDKILNLPQNRAQHDLLKQMERCKQLERERGER